MSKLSKIVKTNREMEMEKPVVNYMGGVSYELNPLETLKMISASSIFGEPQYYRESGVKDSNCNDASDGVKEYSLFDIPNNMTASEIMIKTINKALDYDFKGVIEWARELRRDYYMRLNPQVIMVLAAVHPKRAEFSLEYPGLFRIINREIMLRADEPAVQLTFYLYYNGNKAKIPSVLKRSWCDRIGAMSRYEMAKYKKAEVGLIDTIRVCHASSELVDELMTTGTISVDDEDKTWANLREERKSFKEILGIIKMPHMALLRNLRNIFRELTDNDRELAQSVLKELKDGVKEGKQFPFRYYAALKRLGNDDSINFMSLVVTALEECIDISIDNMPKLKGRTICLSDNSGSAWGSFNSEYGKMTVAEIDNLSAVITAMESEEGYVGKFGDKLVITPVEKRSGALLQADRISNNGYTDVGGNTENGIWLFFETAIKDKKYYDNIFIYSDMQAGHGGLYGIGNDYLIDGESYACNGNYIDVMKLLDKYRKIVNPKVNIFCVQTAGYDNVLIPEYIYRGSVLYGWTGKEALFALKIIEQWDNIEKSKE